ncbi:Restriction endonuclease S subunits-like protein [Dehalococcoides mccartyi]|uniref:Restriction endonuclease S subunits-like protein n=1 Tax=Dehalococcoides mccartyi TaxID=61435 RepID=A0AB33HS62_9CHLR|nr:restriction endonuclease subunit S [Dehalococcoides mccartyi]BAZ97257.1 Restriction endonuclease S subunits-like protein [Dehalococcoides mccartyi]
MNQRISFKELFERVERPITVREDNEYSCVGVRWWGKGAFIREIKSGINIRKKNQYLINPGDIVYNKLFAWRGAFAIADQSIVNCIVSDKFPIYRLTSNSINLDYLKILFQSPALASAAEKLSTGMAAISKFTLNPPKFWELTIPCPSIDEQIRTVKIYDEFCKKANEIINASDSLAIKYLELPKVTAYHLAKSYTYVQLRNIGRIIRRNIKIQDDVSYKQVTIAMNNEGVRLREEKLGFEIGVKNQSAVKSGDLLFSRIDIRNGAIGFVPDYLEGAIVANDFPICELNDNVSKRFLNLYFKTNGLRISRSWQPAKQ